MSRRTGPERREGSDWSPRVFRRGLLLACFMAGGAAVLAKAADLQIVESERWTSAAADQHRERIELPARRGVIYDRKGVPLALSHEMYAVSLAPHELGDPHAAAQALTGGLGLPAVEVDTAVRSVRRWVVLPGRYTEEQRRRVGTLRGVYFDRQFERFYPQGDVGRDVLGAATRDGRALGGIEQQFDTVLRGQPGYSILRRDARGNAQPTISLPVVPPTDGGSVVLTIDFDLQAIADGALHDAIRETGATGGDLLIADPRTGELLAAVSRRDGRSRSLAAITEPFEPGSTLKPFVAATLLAEEITSLEDSVFAERGEWVDGRRTFRDTSPHEWLSLGEAVEVSSNIAVVKFAQQLSPGQQYAYLRDFGLGTLTGIEYPAESSGWLRRPQDWSRLSSASLAMGYEISVTPLQMLSAYGALGNGGVLMEPYLVREVRGPDGRVLERRSPKEVRRVVTEDVARAVTEVLVNVVEQGTATQAGLATFAVAGKTGTSRRTADGRYVEGSYTSTFAGFFPAQDPGIVIFIKLDEPRGDYYGGLTAAPVSRETLQGILAARASPIGGGALLASRREAAPTDVVPTRGGGRGLTDAGRGLVPQLGVGRVTNPGATPPGTYAFVVDDGFPMTDTAGEDEDLAAPAEDSAAPVTVPELAGLSLRDAVSRAHGLGLRVRVDGSGEVERSEPEAGSEVRAGEVVTLIGTRL